MVEFLPRSPTPVYGFWLWNVRTYLYCQVSCDSLHHYFNLEHPYVNSPLNNIEIGKQIRPAQLQVWG